MLSFCLYNSARIIASWPASTPNNLATSYTTSAYQGSEFTRGVEVWGSWTQNKDQEWEHDTLFLCDYGLSETVSSGRTITSAHVLVQCDFLLIDVILYSLEDVSCVYSEILILVDVKGDSMKALLLHHVIWILLWWLATGTYQFCCRALEKFGEANITEQAGIWNAVGGDEEI